MKGLLRFITSPLRFIFNLAGIEFKKVFFTWSETPRKKDETKNIEVISVQDRISDFIEMFRPTRIFFVFNILAFVIFLLLPQGKDAMLVVIEDLSEYHFGSLISLLIGVSGWAVAAEFGARYKIYITDNTGKALTGNRVSYRKQLQRFLSMVYLLLPFVAIFIGVSIVTFLSSNILRDGNWDWRLMWPYLLVIISIVYTARLIAGFYLDTKWIKEFKKTKSKLSNFLKLPPEELNWLTKLYGIYNDYVFAIRKETFYNDSNPELKQKYNEFIAAVKSIPAEEFPDSLILDEERVPKLFRPPLHFNDEFMADFSNPQNYRWKINKAGAYRWIYKNNPNFYKVLHRQVKVITFSAILLLIGISLIPSFWIGAPGLICLSFGCWQGAYTGLLFLDYRYRSSIYVSARWLLITWVFIVSFVDNDHPIRYNEEGKKCDNRISLITHFNRWVNNYRNDTSKIYSTLNNVVIIDKTDTLDKEDSIFIPVIFITAEVAALIPSNITVELLNVGASQY